MTTYGKTSTHFPWILSMPLASYDHLWGRIITIIFWLSPLLLVFFLSVSHNSWWHIQHDDHLHSSPYLCVKVCKQAHFLGWFVAAGVWLFVKMTENREGLICDVTHCSLVPLKWKWNTFWSHIKGLAYVIVSASSHINSMAWSISTLIFGWCSVSSAGKASIDVCEEQTLLSPQLPLVFHPGGSCGV